MGGRPKANDLRDFSKLISKCYHYLFINFHKFSTSQRIDIAKSVLLKAMPTEQPPNTNVTTIIYNINPKSISVREKDILNGTNHRLDEVQSTAETGIVPQVLS